MDIEPSVLKKLVAARYFYQLSTEQAALEQGPPVFAAVSLLQDALETFFIACCDQLNADVPRKIEFIQYIDKINDCIGPDRTLPNKRRLIEINSVRVSAKHHGALPDARELAGYVDDTRRFLESACKVVFDCDFWHLSLVDSLKDSPSKSELIKAQDAIKNRDFHEVLTLCRRALFLEFEEAYDVRLFEKEQINALTSALCKAPQFARSNSYISQYVTDPFDYIVLDRDRIDSDLAKLRIDHAMWWNVRRLTPDVYRFQRDSEWLTKFDIGLFEPKGIEMRAAYVLESMIEIVRRVQISRGSYRSSGTAEYHEVTAAPNSKVLRRALLESEVVYKVGSSPTKLRVQYRSPGLDGKGSFWHVVDFWASDNHDSILIGYLSESDTQP